MPVDYNCDQPPIEHVCFVNEKDRVNRSDATKETALKMMHQLEGWCTDTKASILIDYILMFRPEKIVEIGVWGGKSLVPMAYALKVNKQGKIYGIDPWSSKESVKGQEGSNEKFWGTVDHVAVMRGLKKKLKEFQLEDHVKLVRKTSEDCPLIGSIDILHIDGNHSVEAALIDLNKWVPLVKRGGIIVFDDMYWAGRREPVDWLNENCVKMSEFTGTNRWGIWVKK